MIQSFTLLKKLNRSDSDWHIIPGLFRNLFAFIYPPPSNAPFRIVYLDATDAKNMNHLRLLFKIYEYKYPLHTYEHIAVAR